MRTCWFKPLPETIPSMRAGDVDKVKRRLAQNREAARKSRQRRKAYVHNLEEEVRNSTPDLRPARLLGGLGCVA